jgi:hypothetical protein
MNISRRNFLKAAGIVAGSAFVPSAVATNTRFGR